MWPVVRLVSVRSRWLLNVVKTFAILRGCSYNGTVENVLFDCKCLR
jgi:hypothetical protein